jgi:hypothetical protein
MTEALLLQNLVTDSVVKYRTYTEEDDSRFLFSVGFEVEDCLVFQFPLVMCIKIHNTKK